MRKIIYALALVTLALDGYSQEWKPTITSSTPTTTKTTPVRSTVRKNNYDIKVYGNNDIIVRRTSITYDPKYNMCVTLQITNNTTNKKIVAIKAEMHYSSEELRSVDMETVTKEVTVHSEEAETIFLFGNPHPTYTFMMMGDIIIYFSDGTTQKIS